VIETEGTPYYVEVAPDGSFLYATTLSPDRVLKIALPAFEVVARSAAVSRPNHIALAKDGNTLFVTRSSGGVAKLDAATLGLLGIVETEPDAHAVAVAGDPERLFVAVRGPGTLTVLDPETLETIKEMQIASVPTHLSVLPEGSLLVSAAGSRELLKLDPSSLEVIDRLPLQVQPHQTAATRGR
jgi:DNA-binding beta-propeller fold protein YncE